MVDDLDAAEVNGPGRYRPWKRCTSGESESIPLRNSAGNTCWTTQER